MAKEVKVVSTQGGPTSKMRIKLFDEKTQLCVSDRLLEQAPELLKGPKDQHHGPISIEFNLYSATQVDMAIDYLKKLKGDLPIETKPTKKLSSKKLDKMLTEKEPVLDLLKGLKKQPTQEKIIEYLHGFDFRFLDYQVIEDNVPKDQLAIDPVHAEYQFMARMMKEAKEPANDKYDYRLTVGIKIIGERKSRVLIYLFGKYEEKLKVGWEDIKKINFKKVEKIFIFPEFMDYADRKRWRTEHRKWVNSPDPDKFALSDFYNKYKPYVKVH